jgi:signal peptidase II
VSGRASALLIALIVALDQYTKHLVVSAWQLGDSIPIVPGFFSLTYLRNRGGAFGLFAGLPEGWRVAFFVVFALATVAALVWMLRSTPRQDRVQRLALTSVIGGALGNLYDRIVYGEVVDFLDVYVRDWHWPAFNVADSFITCGVVLLLVASLTTSQESPRSEQSEGVENA